MVRWLRQNSSFWCPIQFDADIECYAAALAIFVVPAVVPTIVGDVTTSSGRKPAAGVQESIAEVTIWDCQN